MEEIQWVAVAVIASAWAVAMACTRAGRIEAPAPKARRGEPHEILMHRLLHREPDGCWTWRVRGVKVPAARTTDVCLEIDPAADSHYCPDCLLGAVRLWDTTARNHPRVVECRDCGSLFGLVYLTGETCGPHSANSGQPRLGGQI